MQYWLWYAGMFLIMTLILTFKCYFFTNHDSTHDENNRILTSTANHSIATRVTWPVTTFSMFPLCIWAVHMSQGVHVWSLHGSILCTVRIEVFFTFPYWEGDKKINKWIKFLVLQATLDYDSHL